jgi:hypothetical protein
MTLMLKKSQSLSPIWENVFLRLINATKFYEILTKSIHIYSLFKLVIFLLENLLPNGEISTNFVTLITNEPLQHLPIEGLQLQAPMVRGPSQVA